MEKTLLLTPTFVMVLLYFLVLIGLFLSRLKMLQEKAVEMDYFKIHQGGEPSSRAVQYTKNFENLFQLPVLFFVWVGLSLYLESYSMIDVVLSWIFVVSRHIHSLVHVTFNHVNTRLSVYVIGMIALMALWFRMFQFLYV